MYVQFADKTKKTIVAVFAVAQDANVYANLGEVTADDPRYQAFYNALPSAAQDGLPAPVSA